MACSACTHDWPLLANLRNDAKLAKSKDFSRGKDLLARGRIREASIDLSKAINVHYRTRKKSEESVSPCEEAIRAEDKLRTAVANMGNLVFIQKN